MNGPLEFNVKATKQTIGAILSAGTNEINIQTSGLPKFNVGTTSTWNSDWTIKSVKLETIGAHFNSTTSLNTFFRTGL